VGSDEERRELGDIIRRERMKAYLLILLSFRIWHLKDVHEALE
jgi:hypothetical protein